jgi:glycosyltransferase involved in cell wall biosynthesis
MGESKLKVLFVCHNHPDLYAGGAETYALQVFDEMRKSEEVEPIFLARVGATPATRFKPHPGTPFGSLRKDDHQCWVFTETSDFDMLHLTLRRKGLFTTYLRDFLLAYRPDVIHIQHTLYLGIDLLRQIKNTLPDIPIVYTLHEYHPICHRDGRMVRTVNEELCDHASPRRCNECFPDIPPAEFFMRKRFIESHFALVDLFLAPSHFLMDRYVEWGIPPARIRFSDYGRPAPRKIQADTRNLRNRLGFFGQLNPYKGVISLLKAMKILAEDGQEDGSKGSPDVHLRIHGTNLEWQSAAFQEEFHALVKSMSSNVTVMGRYDGMELPELMAQVDWVVVPSIWPENSPLVIQEAFQHGRPVICTGIGALKEKVTHGVNGLHFRRADPRSLAGTIRRAVGSPDLWQRLHAGIPPVRSIEEDVGSLIETYHQLRESKNRVA